MPNVTHGQRLPADLAHVLDLASVRIDDVEVIAVAAGPGSFTGLRVGIATAQGLAMAGSRLVVPVSALEALARAAVNATTPIAAWMDAHRGQVFSELFTADGLTVLVPAESSLPTEILAAWDSGAPATPVFIGDGAVRYRAEIAGAVRRCRSHHRATAACRDHRADRGRAPGARGPAPRGGAHLCTEAGRRTGAAPASGWRLSAMERLMWPWSISRLASEAELDRVVEIEAASFSNPWTRDMLVRELRHSDVTRVYVVKLADGRIVAFCACWLVMDEVHINTLAVEASMRGRGIATALLEHVLADVIERRCAPGDARSAPLEHRGAAVVRTARLRRRGGAVEVLLGPGRRWSDPLASRPPRTARRLALKVGGSCGSVQVWLPASEEPLAEEAQHAERLRRAEA